MPEPRVLLCRQWEDGASLSDALRQQGMDVEILPVTRIVPLPPPTEKIQAAKKRPPQAILMTSGNAARHASACGYVSSRPLFTVGMQTAITAREAGFTTIMAAAGSVEELRELVKSRCRPQDGTLLYLRGRDIRTDIAIQFTQENYRMEEVILYAAEAIDAFPANKIKALQDKSYNAAVFYSARQAAIFCTLAHSHGLVESLTTMTAFCLSETIAEALKAAPWQQIVIASPEKLAETIARTLKS